MVKIQGVKRYFYDCKTAPIHDLPTGYLGNPTCMDGATMLLHYGALY